MKTFPPCWKRIAESMEEADRWKIRHQQVRGLAGAVMCETCDVKWHTLMFGKHQKVDMRICVPTRREENASDTRKDCFECEEIARIILLEPAQVLLRKMANEVWTDEQRNVTKKKVVEREWRLVQKRLYQSIGRMRSSAGVGKESETQSQKTWKHVNIKPNTMYKQMRKN